MGYDAALGDLGSGADKVTGTGRRTAPARVSESQEWGAAGGTCVA